MYVLPGDDIRTAEKRCKRKAKQGGIFKVLLSPYGDLLAAKALG